MNKTKVYFFLLTCLLAFAACRQTDDLDASGKTGFLVSLTDDGAVAETRATPQELGDPATENFKLKIVRSATGEELYNGGYTADVIVAPAGFYELTASYGDNPVLALDAPYYEGRVGSVEVKGNQTTSVSIPCKVANALVSVKYENTDRIEAIYSEYHVTVAVGDAAVDINDASQSAYFRAGSSVKISFKGTLKEGGEEKSFDLSGENIPASFAAADHLILTLKMSPDVSITVTKAEVETVTVTETLPMEWLPKPKMEAEGFDGNTLTFAETETKTAKLNLGLSSTLQDIKFKFNFEDEQFAASVQADKEYLLSNPDDKAAIEALGITLPEIGAKTAAIDLSPLVARMQTNAGTTTNNTIEVDVQANNRWSSEDEAANRVYTLVCNRPEFNVSVNPNNVWSKEFTIDEATVTAGNEETIKSKLKYQYRESESEEWIDCGNLLVQFAEHPANKNYQVRGFYRDGIASEPVDVVLETPIQLPNSNMEEWQAQNLGSFVGIPNFWNSYNYYDFLPYQSEESDIWWATNNERSRDYSVSRVKVTSSPCVSYSETIKYNGNRSALLYTSGHGGGYASTSSMLYEEGAFAGSLFIGSYNWSDGTETINQGHTFSVRPSAFTFYYRYDPKNTDTFKAYIELKNGDEVIATGTFIPTESSEDSGWQQATVTIDYVEAPKTATSIFVQFLSTTKTSFSEDDFDKNKSITFPVMGDWNAHIGSMLYIDDISLVYDK